MTLLKKFLVISAIILVVRTINIERLLRRSLVAIVIAGLATGAMAHLAGYNTLADQCWFAATVPVIAGLAYSIVHDLLTGRMGVDAIALLSMVGALALGQPLAGAVIALMYSGGNVLEDLAVGRAERDLRSLVDRAPRIAHRRLDHGIEDVPVANVAVGDTLLVRGGEVIPVDGVISSISAAIDELALTGEPLPEIKARGSLAFGGTLNAGEVFELVASSVAGTSTYAGIVRLVTAAQTAKAPFVRLADRFAAVLLPVTIAVAAARLANFGRSGSQSGRICRGDAVSSYTGGASRIHRRRRAGGAARHFGQGRRPLEALARTHTVLFDKTGTLTVGGARLLSIEAGTRRTGRPGLTTWRRS